MKWTLIISIGLLFLVSSCIKEEGKTVPINALAGNDDSSVDTPRIEDPLAYQAWHLSNSGQSTYSTGQGNAGEDISLAAAMEEGFTGAGVKIAISDSGTDVEHEDLSGNQITGEHRNYSLRNSSQWRGTLPYTQGDDAHGTAVTGLVAAVGWNGIGSRGIAHEAQFASFRYVLDYPNTIPADSILARSIDQTDGNFDIFNYSYGYKQCYFAEEDPLVLEAIEVGASSLRSGKGAIYIQSAGNDFTGYLEDCLGIVVPGTYVGNTNHADDLSLPEKIVVGAVNAIGEKSSYSSQGSNIWISAPGGESGETEPGMLTTDISGCNEGYAKFSGVLNTFNKGTSTENLQCSYTSLMYGTSAAAPVVTGVVALMLEAQPNLTWRDVKHILAETADEIDFALAGTEFNSNGSFDVGPELFHPLGSDLIGHTYDWLWTKNAANVEYSNWYGFGRINAFRAILMANSYAFPLGNYEQTINPRSEEWYYESGEVNLPIPDEDADGVISRISVLHNFVIESVEIQVNIDHANPEELGLILISPSGTESRLLHINSNVYETQMPADKRLLTNAFYSEESLGSWALKVVDAKSSVEGSITNWKICINGHKVTGDGSNPNRVTNAIIAATNYPSSTISPPVSFTASTSSDVVRYELSVGTAPGLTDKAEWTSIGTTTALAQVRDMRLSNNTYYYLNIRAIDSKENASSTVSVYWKAAW